MNGAKKSRVCRVLTKHLYHSHRHTAFAWHKWNSIAKCDSWRPWGNGARKKNDAKKTGNHQTCTLILDGLKYIYYWTAIIYDCTNTPFHRTHTHTNISMRSRLKKFVLCVCECMSMCADVPAALFSPLWPPLLKFQFYCFFHFIRHVHHFYVEFCFKTLPYMVMKMFDRLLRAHSCTPILIHTRHTAHIQNNMPIACVCFMGRWFNLWMLYMSMEKRRLYSSSSRIRPCMSAQMCARRIPTNAHTASAECAFACVRLVVGIFCSYLVVLLLHIESERTFFSAHCSVTCRLALEVLGIKSILFLLCASNHPQPKRNSIFAVFFV